MAKETKRKKEKKADFQKTKLKLGKKQVASNATDTSFKARTIALPQQSIVADRSGKLVSSRGLTVSELALQLRHYSANVRRDAVLGIKDILQLHPVLLAEPLVPELARCIGDDDAAVRKQLYSLLTWMLPLVPRLTAYADTLLLYVTAALSHIYGEVRLDAVRVLDLCLELVPDVSVGWEDAVFNMVDGVSGTGHQKHGERVMNCLLNLLGITGRTSRNELGTSAKLVVLRTLNRFMTQAQGQGEENCTWFFRSSFGDLAEFEYFEGLLTAVGPSEESNDLMDPDTIGASLGSSALLESLQKEGQAAARSASICLYTLLHPVLLATLLDTAPETTMSQHNDMQSTSAQVLQELFSLVVGLWRGKSGDADARKLLAVLVGHMSPYFPFSENSNVSGKGRIAVVQMDLAYAELTALLSLHSRGMDRQLGEVSQFISNLLSTPVSEPGTVTLASGGETLDPQMIRTLLPTLWFLLATRDELLDSLLASYHSATKSVKPLLFEFLARTYLLSFSRGKVVSEAAANKVSTSLLSTLPRTLWEASSTNHDFVGLMLAFLHNVLMLPVSQDLSYDGLRAFYIVKHPASGKMVTGPYARLPPNLKKLALDNATLLGHTDPRFTAIVQDARKTAV